MDFPSEFRWVGYLIGVHWPEGDEDTMRELSRAYFQARDDLRAVRPDLTRLVPRIEDAYPQGGGGESIQNQMKALTTGQGGFDDLVAGLGDLGKAADDMATQLESMKLNFYTSLAVTAGDLASTLALPPGAQEGAEETIIALGRRAAKLIAQRGVRAIEELATDAAWVGLRKFLLRHVGLAAALGGGQDLGVQAYERLNGHGAGINWGEVASSAAGGAAGALAMGAFGASTVGKFLQARLGLLAAGMGLADGTRAFRAAVAGGMGLVSSPVAAGGMWAGSSAASGRLQPMDLSMVTAGAFQGTVGGATHELVEGMPGVRSLLPGYRGGDAAPPATGHVASTHVDSPHDTSVSGAPVAETAGPSHPGGPVRAGSVGGGDGAIASSSAERPLPVAPGETESGSAAKPGGAEEPTARMTTRVESGTENGAVSRAGADRGAPSASRPAPAESIRASAPAGQPDPAGARQDAVVSAARQSQEALARDSAVPVRSEPERVSVTAEPRDAPPVPDRAPSAVPLRPAGAGRSEERPRAEGAAVIGDSDEQPVAARRAAAIDTSTRDYRGDPEPSSSDRPSSAPHGDDTQYDFLNLPDSRTIGDRSAPTDIHPAGRGSDDSTDPRPVPGDAAGRGDAGAPHLPGPWEVADRGLATIRALREYDSIPRQLRDEVEEFLNERPGGGVSVGERPIHELPGAEHVDVDALEEALPPGATIADVAGAYDPRTRRILVNSGVQRVRAAAHEFWHAFDHSRGWLSADRRWTALYERAKSSLRAESDVGAHHFENPQELFAEAGAAWTSHPQRVDAALMRVAGNNESIARQIRVYFDDLVAADRPGRDSMPPGAHPQLDHRVLHQLDSSVGGGGHSHAGGEPGGGGHPGTDHTTAPLTKDTKQIADLHAFPFGIVKADEVSKLITSVDGKPIAEYIDSVAHDRANQFAAANAGRRLQPNENQHQNARRNEQSRLAHTYVGHKTHGAVNSCVVDRRTGAVFEGLNGTANDKLELNEMHKTLRENILGMRRGEGGVPRDYPALDRNGQLGNGRPGFPAGRRPYPHFDNPAGHAEVKALDAALKAREEANKDRRKEGLRLYPTGPEALREFYTQNYFPFKDGEPTPAPYCANCHNTMGGAHNHSGRFTGFPPDDSNLTGEYQRAHDFNPDDGIPFGTSTDGRDRPESGDEGPDEGDAGPGEGGVRGPDEPPPVTGGPGADTDTDADHAAEALSQRSGQLSDMFERAAEQGQPIDMAQLHELRNMASAEIDRTVEQLGLTGEQAEQMREAIHAQLADGLGLNAIDREVRRQLELGFGAEHADALMARRDATPGLMEQMDRIRAEGVRPDTVDRLLEHHEQLLATSLEHARDELAREILHRELGADEARALEQARESQLRQWETDLRRELGIDRMAHELRRQEVEWRLGRELADALMGPDLALELYERHLGMGREISALIDLARNDGKPMDSRILREQFAEREQIMQKTMSYERGILDRAIEQLGMERTPELERRLAAHLLARSYELSRGLGLDAIAKELRHQELTRRFGWDLARDLSRLREATLELTRDIDLARADGRPLDLQTLQESRDRTEQTLEHVLARTLEVERLALERDIDRGMDREEAQRLLFERDLELRSEWSRDLGLDALAAEIRWQELERDLGPERAAELMLLRDHERVRESELIRDVVRDNALEVQRDLEFDREPDLGRLRMTNDLVRGRLEENLRQQREHEARELARVAGMTPERAGELQRQLELIRTAEHRELNRGLEIIDREIARQEQGRPVEPRDLAPAMQRAGLERERGVGREPGYLSPDIVARSGTHNTPRRPWVDASNADDITFETLFPNLTLVNPDLAQAGAGWRYNCPAAVLATDRCLAEDRAFSASPRTLHGFDWPRAVEDRIGGGTPFTLVTGPVDIVGELYKAARAGAVEPRGVVWARMFTADGTEIAGHAFNAVYRRGLVFFVDGYWGGFAPIDHLTPDGGRVEYLFLRTDKPDETHG